MQFRREMGIMYDAIFLIQIQFSEDAMADHISRKTSEPEKMFRFCYSCINKFPMKIPEQLKALFYYDGYNISFMSQEFSNMSVDESSFDTFEAILKDTDLLFENLLRYYFDDTVFDVRDSKLLYDKISHLSCPEEIKLSLMCILNDFEQTMDSVVSLLKTSYQHTEKMHILHQNIIRKAFEEYEQENTQRALEKMGMKDIEDDERDIVCSISLFHDLIIISKYNPVTETLGLVLGIHAFELLDIESEFNHITIESYSDILNSPIKRKIYELLCKYKELTPTDIARMAFTTQSTAGRNLNSMSSEKAIVISRRTKLSVYYSLNPEYFKQAKVIHDKYVNKLSELHAETVSVSKV